MYMLFRLLSATVTLSVLPATSLLISSTAGLTPSSLSIRLQLFAAFLLGEITGGRQEAPVSLDAGRCRRA